MILLPSAATPPLFPDFVVHLGMAVADQDGARWGIPLPPQLTNAVARRRAEFICGRLCAREALGRLAASCLDIPMAADRSPLWPAGFVGSITHSQDMAFAAVARTEQAQSLGLDVERLMPPETALELASIVASPAEYARLLQAPWDHPLLTTVLFSAKETIFKCLYPVIKRQFDFSDVVIESLDLRGGTFTFSLSRAIAELHPPAARQPGRLAIIADVVHTGLMLVPAGDFNARY